MPKANNADILLLAAGFGKRLRPLTDTCPKPLIQVGGKPLLDWHLERIVREGFKKVFINTHYQRGKFREHFLNNHFAGITIELVEEEVLLDTGGAIKNIEGRLQEKTLLTINSDTFLGIDFSLLKLLEAHQNHSANPVATMVLRRNEDTQSFGEIRVDATGRVVRFLEKEYFPGEGKEPLVFTGVQALSRDIFSYMPPQVMPFSITRETHVNILRQHGYIHSILYDGYWNDIGTPERLERVQREWDRKGRS